MSADMEDLAATIAIGQTWIKDSFPVPTVVTIIDWDGDSVSMKFSKGRKCHLSKEAFIGRGFRLGDASARPLAGPELPERGGE